MWHNLIKDSIWTLRLATFTISHTLIICQNHVTPETFDSNSHSLITTLIFLDSSYCVSHNTFTLAFRRSYPTNAPFCPRLLYCQNAVFHINSSLHSSSRACHLHTPRGCTIWCYRFLVSPMAWILDLLIVDFAILFFKPLSILQSYLRLDLR